MTDPFNNDLTGRAINLGRTAERSISIKNLPTYFADILINHLLTFADKKRDHVILTIDDRVSPRLPLTKEEAHGYISFANLLNIWRRIRDNYASIDEVVKELDNRVLESYSDTFILQGEEFEIVTTRMIRKKIKSEG